MRRIRHLMQCDYVVHVGQRINQLLTLSPQCNIVLERTWHKLGRNLFEIQAHIKFNADTMNGIQVMSRMTNRGIICSSVITAARLYRVSDADWTETLIGSFTPVESSPRLFTLSINQSSLGSNELSGKETYAIEFDAARKRKKFKKKFWFNHLGSFDSLHRLRAESNYHHILKLDE